MFAIFIFINTRPKINNELPFCPSKLQNTATTFIPGTGMITLAGRPPYLSLSLFLSFSLSLPCFCLYKYTSSQPKLYMLGHFHSHLKNFLGYFSLFSDNYVANYVLIFLKNSCPNYEGCNHVTAKWPIPTGRWTTVN